MTTRAPAVLKKKIFTVFIQEGIETIDAAYETFQDGIEDLQDFEPKTCANKNLKPRRIKEYLQIIHQEQGFAICQVQQFTVP